MVARGIAAANGDGVGCFLEDFKVVGDAGALVVIAGGELFVGPELAFCFGAAPFDVEVFALNHVA